MNKRQIIEQMESLEGNGWDEYNAGFKEAICACVAIVDQRLDEPPTPEGCEVLEKAIDFLLEDMGSNEHTRFYYGIKNDKESIISQTKHILAELDHGRKIKTEVENG